MDVPTETNPTEIALPATCGRLAGKAVRVGSLVAACGKRANVTAIEVVSDAFGATIRLHCVARTTGKAFTCNADEVTGA